MKHKALVASTRRLPTLCEARLEDRYRFRRGDDTVDYSTTTLAAHAQNAEAVIVTPTDPLDATSIAALPQSIKVISTFSVGFEHIDLPAARARGIRVTNTPGVLTDATADLAMLLILAATRRSSEGERFLRAGKWRGIRPTQLLGRQITGKRLGIVGMGRIGRATAQRASAFGMKIFYHNRHPAPDSAGDFQFVPTIDALLASSDVLSLHCPLTAETRGLLDAKRIAQLPPGCVVVNTARGGLIDDEALITALGTGHVGAAGLDVYANEPAFDRRYLTLDNVVLLPHLGSATTETRTAMGMCAIDNVDAVLEGREPPYPIA